ncbi:PucR family transcriptional regulator [Microlunatus ginsengisoli]|uniref:Helix-turn-helix domain-containing protein n=1 Tax=Microlunatus ginsengisoli TaxID=363863 RepID=A0ABP7AVW8_9ACTN
MTDQAADPVVVALSARLLPDAAELGRAMADRIKTEIPLYRDGQVVSDDELRSSCTANVRYILGTLARRPGISADAPRRTGAARAERGISYAAVLQAFRVGSRFIWEILVERCLPEERPVLTLAAADIWAVSDDLALQVTDVYRDTLAERARRDAQLRVALLDTLLDPATTAEDAWESAGLIDLPRRGEFVAVVGECPATGREALPGVEALLRGRGLLSLWRLDHDHQEGLVALRVGYRIERLAEDLAAIARGRLGFSDVFGEIDRAPEARRAARLACTAGTPGSTELVRYEQQPLAILLAGTPELARWYAGRVLGDVLAPDGEHAVLLETARVWLAEKGSTSAAAARLFLHRNTVRYRLRRLEQLTGRDLADPAELAEIRVALECARIHPGRSGTEPATGSDLLA